MLEIKTTKNFPLPMTERERLLLKDLVDYSQVHSIPEIWSVIGGRFGDTLALLEPHSHPEVMFTYTQLYQQIKLFAGGLQSLGVQVGICISLIADNSPRWLIADQGIIMAGAVNTVRSPHTDREELLYILENSLSTVLAIQNLQTLEKLREGLNNLPIRLVILLTDEIPPETETITIINFSQLIEMGKKNKLQIFQKSRNDLATIMYTSGTTGKPKGIMLSHGNMMHQVSNLGTIVQPQPGDVILSVLPTWHTYERSSEYFLLAQGCTLIYTSIRFFTRDLKQYRPHYMVVVPRILESIYEAIQKQFREQSKIKQHLVNILLSFSKKYIQAKHISQKLDLNKLNPSTREIIIANIQKFVLFPLHWLADQFVYKKVREVTGGRVKQIISGGSTLPQHIDTFFEIIGVDILVGYGLTETSPVTHARRHWSNLRGSSGKPIPGTETKIVHPENYQAVKTGEKGLVLLRGPQVMQGYYQNSVATHKAIDSEGWFNSGDLGWLTVKNDLVLTGRVKDTIVLSNGENIEPQPIEDACLQSPYIHQIMLVGQDYKSLGALIVPNFDALEKWMNSKNLQLSLDDASLAQAEGQRINLESKIIQSLFRQELNREVKNRPGYCLNDLIGPFKLIPEPFSVENGTMTQTLKIKRYVVTERDRHTIKAMFSQKSQ